MNDQASQLRELKNAQQPQRRSLARVITVTSGKGGVGKSNTAINLAIQFKKMGKRVIILDADFGLANIEIMFGAVPKHNLYDLIFTKLDETSALGNLLNLKLYTGANMSYVTNGQNVPDDIEEFDPQKTVKQLLGGR